MTATTGWEVRHLPWRNPRTGITSADEFTIIAVHRERGWVLRLDRRTQNDVDNHNPDAAWASRI